MHDLIGKGVAEARRRQGLTQEETARRFQDHGLTAWRTSTVGSLEAGLRRPGLDEILLMAAALRVTVDQLIPGGDNDRVELGDGATVSPRWIREMLTGELRRDRKRPLLEMPYAQFPVQKILQEAMRRLAAESARVEAENAPILTWAQKNEAVLTTDDWDAIFEPASDSEQHVARRLGVATETVKLSARTLWDHRDFDEERDRRVGSVGDLAPRSRQARRGLIARKLTTELDAFLDKVGFPRKGGGGGGGER
jgi:transcriptional regulator with XRE-family HTH domain